MCKQDFERIESTEQQQRQMKDVINVLKQLYTLASDNKPTSKLMIGLLLKISEEMAKLNPETLKTISEHPSELEAIFTDDLASQCINADYDVDLGTPLTPSVCDALTEAQALGDPGVLNFMSRAHLCEVALELWNRRRQTD